MSKQTIKIKSASQPLKWALESLCTTYHLRFSCCIYNLEHFQQIFGRASRHCHDRASNVDRAGPSRSSSTKIYYTTAKLDTPEVPAQIDDDEDRTHVMKTLYELQNRIMYEHGCAEYTPTGLEARAYCGLTLVIKCGHLVAATV